MYESVLQGALSLPREQKERLGAALREAIFGEMCFCQPIVPQIHDGCSPLSWRGFPHPHDRVSKPVVST